MLAKLNVKRKVAKRKPNWNATNFSIGKVIAGTTFKHQCEKTKLPVPTDVLYLIFLSVGDWSFNLAEANVQKIFYIKKDPSKKRGILNQTNWKNLLIKTNRAKYTLLFLEKKFCAEMRVWTSYPATPTNIRADQTPPLGVRPFVLWK